MKKFVLFIIIVNLSFAGGNIVYKKTKTGGNTLYETLVSVKKGLIGNVNFFIPDYLKINPEESFFCFQISYSTLEKKISNSVSLHLKLPGLTFSRTAVNNTRISKRHIQSKTLSESFTFRPYIRLRHSGLKFFIKGDLLIKKTDISTQAFNQQFFYYPFEHRWEEKSIFIVKKNNYTFNATVLRSRENPFFTYTPGIYKSFIYNRRLYIIGYSFTGYTNESPFCYSHKINIVFRREIKTKRIYFEIEPYLLYSKTYGYHLKEAVNISLNYKF